MQKSYMQLWLKFSGKVKFDQRWKWLNFGDNPQLSTWMQNKTERFITTAR